VKIELSRIGIHCELSYETEALVEKLHDEPNWTVKHIFFLQDSSASAESISDTWKPDQYLWLSLSSSFGSAENRNLLLMYESRILEAFKLSKKPRAVCFDCVIHTQQVVNF